MSIYGDNRNLSYEYNVGDVYVGLSKLNFGGCVIFVKVVGRTRTGGIRFLPLETERGPYLDPNMRIFESKPILDETFTRRIVAGRTTKAHGWGFTITKTTKLGGDLKMSYYISELYNPDKNYRNYIHGD